MKLTVSVCENKFIKHTLFHFILYTSVWFGLVQIRMQAEYRSGTNVVRKGMIRSFLSMFREEGARGLYRVICKNLCIVCMMAL